MERGRAWVGLAAAVLAGPGCLDPTLVLGPGETSLTGETGVPVDTGASDDAPPPDVPFVPPCDPDSGCRNKLDLLFVIDNSGTMGEEQLNLARNFPLLIEGLQGLTDGEGHPVGPDVNVMVTTTDLGDNPSCPQIKPDYVAARGAPIDTPCTERLERFTGYTALPPYPPGPTVIEEACTLVCDPVDPIRPEDPFLHFSPLGDNVPDGTPEQALSCIGPQGIDGCGYEAPLEAMAQALNPTACWNDPSGCTDPSWEFDKAFLRDDAVLAIAIITDETDCSVRDYSIMTNLQFMEDNPEQGFPTSSSAICWHAGVECGDVDPETGVYGGCATANKDMLGSAGVPDGEAVLQPVTRYVSLLQALRDQGREVIMLGIFGVPPVTEHAASPPYQPTAGGVAALVYRDWKDPVFPGGDVLPDEWNSGVRAANKQWEFGIGPGCTGVTDDGNGFTGQAIPPGRLQTVCESLDTPDDPSTPAYDPKIRCCIESICSSDFSPALNCLTGLVEEAFKPVG